MLARNFFHRRRQHVARAAPIRPEIHHHRLRLARLDHVRLEVCVVYRCYVFSHRFYPRPACPLRCYQYGRPRYILDVREIVGILARFAASYTVTYAAADAFHEKSLLMPLACSLRHAVPLRYVFSAVCKHSSSAVPEYSSNLNPVPCPVFGSKFWIVSSKPPVALTTGTVPYRKL